MVKVYIESPNFNNSGYYAMMDRYASMVSNFNTIKIKKKTRMTNYATLFYTDRDAIAVRNKIDYKTLIKTTLLQHNTKFYNLYIEGKLTTINCYKRAVEFIKEHIINI